MGKNKFSLNKNKSILFIWVTFRGREWSKYRPPKKHRNGDRDKWRSSAREKHRLTSYIVCNIRLVVTRQQIAFESVKLMLTTYISCMHI
ncbi:hypothetical protein DBV15_02635 [Temnothorax longispinosus]|uniref:Uncharacterized protein n=1 Tax=Temnothorax longispinosus TaxID=300112 RepID=A0A4S2KE13_9HYME|nr:hypothetical protein DBV15_02635 [Temnothorax longispinosus]